MVCFETWTRRANPLIVGVVWALAGCGGGGEDPALAQEGAVPAVAAVDGPIEQVAPRTTIQGVEATAVIAPPAGTPYSDTATAEQPAPGAGQPAEVVAASNDAGTAVASSDALAGNASSIQDPARTAVALQSAAETLSSPAPAASPVAPAADTAATVSSAQTDAAASSLQLTEGLAQIQAVPMAAPLAANRVSTAISDMATNHEVVPLGVGTTVGWKYKPSVAMNTNPYGWAIPSFWKGIRYSEWRALVPWFVVYEGEPRNSATNTMVEISGIEAWVYLQSTRRWSQLGAAIKPVWDSVYAQNAVDLVSYKTSSSVAADSVRYVVTPGTIVHGGLGQIATPWAAGAGDIRAVYVSVRHRLVVKDATKPDDRAQANFGLQVGMDYYPWMGSKLSDLGASYVPGAGGGRFLKVTSGWRYSNLLLRRPDVPTSELTGSRLPTFLY